MDCKYECAARTFLRIETIILQGVVLTILKVLGLVLVMPAIPFVVAVHTFLIQRERTRLWKRMLLLPLWLLSGVLFAIVMPFSTLWSSLKDMKTIVEVEWKTRWLTGQPKKPSGHPISVDGEMSEEQKGLAAIRSVVRDYNEEARSYGQGIDIDETTL